MKAVILAAGRGSYFQPFDYYRPKTLWPVCEKPLLGHLFDRLKAVGLEQVAVVAGHRKERIAYWLAANPQEGLAVTLLEQRAPLGTADALLVAEEWLAGEDALVLYGDLAFGPGVLPQVLEAFQQAELGVVATKQVEKAGHYARAHSVEGKASGYSAPEAEARQADVLAGIWALRPAAVRLAASVSGLLQETFVGTPPKEERDLVELIPLASAAGTPLSTCALENWWVDVDFAWDTIRAYRHLFDERIAKLAGQVVVAEGGLIEEGARVSGPVYVGPGAVVEAGACLEGPLWLEAGARVRFGSLAHSGTWVGKGSLVGPNAEVRGMLDEDCAALHCCEFEGIALKGSRFSHYMELAGIFGEGSEIGAGTMMGTLRFDNGPTRVKLKGRYFEAEELSGVLYGDYSRTGVGALLMPGRIIGPGGIVGAGVVLEQNVAPHTLLRLEQQTVITEWPQEIYEP